MQNGEYFWIKPQRGYDWEIGMVSGPELALPTFARCGCIGNFEVFEIGPKVISPVLQPERAVMPKLCKLTCGFCGYEHYADPCTDEPCRKCRDRFAMAALAGFGTDIDADRTAELCYAQADAMLAARSKLKS